MVVRSLLVKQSLVEMAFFNHIYFFNGYIGTVVPHGLFSQLLFVQVLVCSGISGLGVFPDFIGQ